MKLKRYNKENPPEKEIEIYVEEYPIHDFIMEEGKIIPTIKQVDKRNFYKLAQAQADSTDIERIKKIAKSKSESQFKQLEIMNNCFSEIKEDPLPYGDLPLTATSKTEMIQQIKELETQSNKALSELPPALREEIQKQANNKDYTMKDLMSFIQKEYQVKEESKHE